MKAQIKLSCHKTGRFWRMPVLYEDDYILAVEKPAGLSLTQEPTEPDVPGLLTLLRQEKAKHGEAPHNAAGYLNYVYRMDPEMTGVLLLAKDKSVYQRLAEQFGSERSMSVYSALVVGAFPREPLFVDAKLTARVLKGRVHVGFGRGKKAVTEFKAVEGFRGFSRIECYPRTFKRHQIRAHLWWCKQPLVGDNVYGGDNLFLSSLKPGYRHKKDKQEKPLIGRPAVHADKIWFEHPVTTETLTIESPWPQDFAVAVKYLRRFAA
ncbi:MAG: hypothetical protein K9N48_02310 [Verrucomicrobia bacterium]|nr:hypothetical protein [Verrucomicrobiota bacterium]MCF7708814.1 hypothetical protein [Verrucomicrobiota bacterium]